MASRVSPKTRSPSRAVKENAPSAIFLTVEGMLTVFNWVAFQKQFVGISVIPSGSVTLSKLWQFRNADMPIAVTVEGILISVKA